MVVHLIAQTNVSRYGGKSKIIPISIDTFKQMITKAYKSNTKPTAKMIRDFLQDAYCLVESCNDENQWYTSVKSLAENWLS